MLATGSLWRLTACMALAVGLGLSGLMGPSPAAAHSGPVHGAVLHADAADQQGVPDRTRRIEGDDYIDKQIARMLRKEQEAWPSMRISYIRAAIEVASNQENVDLSRTTGALLDIVEGDPNSENRRMAVQALHEIGPDHVGEQRYRQAMGRLHALMQAEKSKQVRDAAARALTQYTG